MKKGKFDKFLTILLIILSITIIAMLGVLGYSFYQKVFVTRETSDFLDEFDKIIVELGEQEIPEPSNNVDTTNGGTRGINTDSLYYRGYKVVGKIDMPSVKLKYPVLDYLTDAKAIDYSVALQYGAGLNKIGNTIIIGHNYRNGLFFGSNKRMNIGDKIYITDLLGNEICYIVYNKYITPQEDFSYAYIDTQGKREITLVTCDSNNKNRLIICAREEIN